MKFIKNLFNYNQTLTAFIIIGIVGGILLTALWAWHYTEIAQFRLEQTIVSQQAITKQNSPQKQDEPEPIKFSGQNLDTFVEEIFGFSFQYPTDQILISESVNGNGDLIEVGLSTNSWPYQNVIKFETVAHDSENYYQEIEVYPLENGYEFAIGYKDDMKVVKPDQVINNDWSQIVLFKDIAFEENIKIETSAGYFAVLALGDKNYQAINVEANRELISYADFFDFLNSIKKVEFSTTDCPAPEIKSWGKTDYLRLCNRNTSYPAALFNDLKIILFKSYNGLELISTEKPYSRTLLGKDVPLVENCSSLEESSLIACNIWASGPGDMITILTIDPETKKYIYVNDAVFGPKKSLDIASSYSEDNFNAHLEAACDPENSGPFGCNYADALSLDITVNNKTYNKEDYLENVDNLQIIFKDCRGFDWRTFSNIRQNEVNIDIDNFPPEKLYCNNEDIDTYFDLKTNKFIIN